MSGICIYKQVVLPYYLTQSTMDIVISVIVKLSTNTLVKHSAAKYLC